MRVFRNSSAIFQRTAWFPVRPLLYFLGVTYHGTENLTHLSSDRGVIFAANHASLLDPLLLGAGLPYFSRLLPISFVSRPVGGYDHMSFIPRMLFGGYLFAICGSYPAYKGRKNLEDSLPHHLKILSKRGSVAIFPEGGIPDPAVEDFSRARPGVAFLSLKTGAPIIPAYIDTQSTPMSVTYGKPIMPAEFSVDPSLSQEDQYRPIAQEIMKRVFDLKKQR